MRGVFPSKYLSTALYERGGDYAEFPLSDEGCEPLCRARRLGLGGQFYHITYPADENPTDAKLTDSFRFRLFKSYLSYFHLPPLAYS